jgi:plastocyanin
MRIPRILFAAPLLAAGIFLPAAGDALVAPAGGVVGMDHEVFTQNEVTLHQGQTLTLTNNSRWIHIIGAGRGGRLDDATSAIPVDYRRLMESNQSYTSGKWEKPGTYFITCSVHPLMTVKVVVTKCDCCAGGTC